MGNWGGVGPEYVQDPLDRLRAVENFDPLAEAEKITGKSYKEDEGTGIFGMLLQIDKSEKKARILNEMQDLQWGMSWDLFVQRIEANGYRRLMLTPYQSDARYRKGPVQEFYGQWISGDGVMINADSHLWNNGEKGDDKDRTLNVVTAYYCWKPDFNKVPEEEISRCTSSGGYERFDGRRCVDLSDEECHLRPAEWDPTVISRDPKDWPDAYYHNGSNGSQDGLISKLNRMRRLGKFVCPWPALAFCWHHGVSAYDREKEVEGFLRIPMHPEAQEILGVKNWSKAQQERVNLSGFEPRK